MSDYTNIEKFIGSSFIKKSKTGLLRPNRFKVFISPPNKLSGGLSGEDITFNAVAVQNPEIEVSVKDLMLNNRRWSYYEERIDSDLMITFLETPDLKISRYFNEWIRLGFDVITKKRKFLKDIVGNSIKVVPLNADGTLSTHCHVFYEVFPFGIGDINYDFESENQIQKITVKFKYVVHDIGTTSGTKGPSTTSR